jgi:hypothetical protein
VATSYLSGAVACVFLTSVAPAAAAPIPAAITGCVGSTCTIEPTGGPVAVDPTGFTLDIDWAPDCLELVANSDGEWWMRLNFEFTGEHDGTENFGTVTLYDKHGLPIPALNVQFDDTNVVGNVIPAVYQIFGPEDTPFIIQGLSLTNSDGSGVDTMNWVSARFFDSAPAECPQCPVPEPSVMLLVGAGLAGTLIRRRRQA